MDLQKPFTLEAYARHFFPGIKVPMSSEARITIEKSLIRAGFRDRGTYWSKKLEQKPKFRAPFASRVIGPKYIKYPRGEFTTRDFLSYNRMNLYPENFEWAREQLKGVDCIQRGPHRWLHPNRKGRPNSVFTGQWVLPPESPKAFTTVQFQRVNNCWNAVTAEQWRIAVEWLHWKGYNYDPRLKRWVHKSTEI